MKTIDPIAPTQLKLEPEWIRIKQACDWASFSKSVLYRLMSEGKIRFVSLRERGTAKGTRLISFKSLKSFLESRAEGGQA